MNAYLIKAETHDGEWTIIGHARTQQEANELVVRSSGYARVWSEFTTGVLDHLITKSEKAPKTIDLTPTWSAILPAFLAVLENGTEKGKEAAREELKRMAQAADQFNELVKERSSEKA